ncbi:hypothetical protein QE152_g29708 [Popillia japonica]|uniref:Peptidase A2 domain-containing protein n=1 Tax=Popillia japonica TaxID=7064 RepID=A0AAW1JH39_POPJA
MQIKKSCGLKKKFKHVEVNGVRTKALIDTGSNVNLVRPDEMILSHRSSRVNLNKTRLSGLGGAEVLTLGGIKVEMDIDNHKYTTVVHIVSEQAMEMKFLLGTELLNQAQVTITADKAECYPS